MNISKSSGPVNIPNILLKECAAELSPLITHHFQKPTDSGPLPRTRQVSTSHPNTKKKIDIKLKTAVQSPSPQCYPKY